MKACNAHNVKRCVLTSSCAAIGMGYARDDPERPEDGFDESHWSKLDGPGMNGYFKSKTLAEKAAWDYQATLDEKNRFELVVVCPGFVQGPSLTSGDGTSEGFVKGILTGAMPEVQKIAWPFVDVRNVAEAHIKAIQIAEAKNQRFILSAESVWHRDYAADLAAEFGP